MLARRALLMHPALYLSAQVRTISFARIALEPVKKVAPPPPRRAAGKPASKKPATSKKASTTPSKTTTKKAAAAASPRRRLTDKEKAAREKQREREKAARAKAIEKEKIARAKEREKKERAREREKEKIARAKEREREKKERAREREKENIAKVKARERERKVRAREREKEKKEREKERKEREKLKAEQAKALKKPYPPPPKRPATGYILFASDPKVKRDRGTSVIEDAVKAGKAWRALSDAEREAYNKKYEKAHAQWKEDVAKWVASLNFAQLTAARANREPGTHDESALKTLPNPPGNAYAIFSADLYRRPDFRNRVEALAKKESDGDDTKLSKIRFELAGRTLAAMWKSMTEKEKAVYAVKYADARKQWEKNYGSTLAAQKEALVSAYT